MGFSKHLLFHPSLVYGLAFQGMLRLEHAASKLMMALMAFWILVWGGHGNGWWCYDMHGNGLKNRPGLYRILFGDVIPSPSTQ